MFHPVLDIQDGWPSAAFSGHRVAGTMREEGGPHQALLEEPRLPSGGCWHGFSLPAGPHQVRVLITGRPLVL